MEYVVARVSQQGQGQGHHYYLSHESSVAADHRPTPVSQRTRGSAMTQQRRRQALEQEVAELKQQLSNQETVHQILERALQPSSARSAILTIPAFIPAKAKELLAELLLVEEEIARLEGKIQAMKQGGGGSRAAAAAPPEIKSMFFISQAMDMAMIKTAPPPPKEAAMPMSSSPKFAPIRSSRHSIEGRRHPAAAAAAGAPTAANKLSERIVKCLLCIFIRLLRSSRVADLDTSRNQLHQQAGSFSFRIDTALNVDKDSRGQQDHYGMFAFPDAIVRDVGPYKNLVRFTSTSLDLRGFSTSPLVTKLRQMLEALQQVDARSSLTTHHQKLAFWLNVYNTCIMHGILQHGLPSNSDKLLALKNKATINVSGQTFNALVIENFILRQPSSVKQEFWKCDVDVEEQQVRELYGLKSSEPNILFALCCGIRSSPALRIYKADRVSMELEKAKLEYLQASLVVTSTRRLLIPALIHSNMHDFAKDMDSLLRWICDQLPTSWSLRKSMVDCLRHLNMETTTEQLLVDVIPLDYDFQYLLPM